MLARGLGRSYGDAALNEGGSVVLDTRLNRFISFEPSTGIIECEAGVSFADLIGGLLSRGYFPPVTPGTQFVTIGGAIAATAVERLYELDPGQTRSLLIDEMSRPVPRLPYRCWTA